MHIVDVILRYDDIMIYECVVCLQYVCVERYFNIRRDSRTKEDKRSDFLVWHVMSSRSEQYERIQCDDEGKTWRVKPNDNSMKTITALQKESKGEMTGDKWSHSHCTQYHES